MTKENKKSTQECRKGCDVFADWQANEALLADLVHNKEKAIEKLKEALDCLCNNKHLAVMDLVKEALAPLQSKEPCKKCGGSGQLPVKDGGIPINADNENYLGICPSCQKPDIEQQAREFVAYQRKFPVSGDFEQAIKIIEALLERGGK